MGFKLLNVDEFIKNKKAQEVTTAKTFNYKSGLLIPDPNGLYSPQIFGQTIKEKREKYGYINLKTTILHPFVFKNLAKVNSLFLNVAKGSKKAIVNDGELIENEQGKTGIDYLISVWDKIDFEKYKRPTNEDFIDFLKFTKDNLIKINKIIVIPILYRPSRVNNGRVEEDEISEKYKNILLDIFNTHGLDMDSENEFDALKFLNQISDTPKSLKLQDKVKGLYDYFISKLDKKDGFFRSAFIGKRIDNVTRLVANARPDMPVDCVGVPWHVLLSLFDVYVLKYLNKNKEFMEKLGIKDISTDDFGKHIYYIYKNCDTYCKTYPDRQEIWIKVLENVFNENPFLRVLMKRDPAWAASSYWCLKPIIIKGCQYHTVVNSFYYKPLGGDSFNFDYMITPDNETKIKIEDYEIQFSNLYKIQTLDKLYKETE